MKEKKIEKIYFVGIKGVGMAALAVFAKELGYEVSGSDVEENFVTDEALEKAGIPVFPFDAQNLKDKPDLVVVSAAYDKDHPEIKEARKKHLEIKPSSEFLGMISSNFQTIAVAGIHGKTTVTAMVSFLLSKANFDPSYIIGVGKIPLLENSAHLGQGKYLVVEADEYRKSQESDESKFFDLSPEIEVITGIEMDHPDMFNTEDKVYQAFYKFACRIPRTGFVVLCTDYQKSYKLLNSLVDRKFETYGFNLGAAWQIVDFKEEGDYSQFFLLHKDVKMGPFKIKVPGTGNALNAAATIIVGLKLGIDERIIKKYLPIFSGVKRRFEKVGQIGDLTVIDDYAHHPRAIDMTLQAAKKRFPNAKIWCIFQSHTFSRTKELLSDFAKSFKSADKVIIADIYASAREKNASISGNDLAMAISKFQPQVKYINDNPRIIQELADNVKGETLIITMGAGDVYKLAPEILEKFKKVKNEEKN